MQLEYRQRFSRIRRICYHRTEPLRIVLRQSSVSDGNEMKICDVHVAVSYSWNRRRSSQMWTPSSNILWKPPQRAEASPHPPRLWARAVGHAFHPQYPSSDLWIQTPSSSAASGVISMTGFQDHSNEFAHLIWNKCDGNGSFRNRMDLFQQISLLQFIELEHC